MIHLLYRVHKYGRKEQHLDLATTADAPATTTTTTIAAVTTTAATINRNNYNKYIFYATNSTVSMLCHCYNSCFVYC